MIRSLLAASAVLLVALPARAARPDDAVTLEYAPSRSIVAVCPAADFLAVEVQIRLGYELIQPSAPLHLSVKIDRVNGRFQSVGEMRDDDGKITFTRTYSEIDCTQAVVSMAVSVAVRFTRAAEPPDPSPPPPPCPVEPPPPTLAETPPEPPPPVTAPPERSRFQVGVASVFSIGNAPVVLGGVGWSLGVRRGDLSAALEGRALFAPSAELDARATRYSFVAVSLTPCLHHAWAFACARFELGSLVAGKFGLSAPISDTVLSFGAGMRLGGNVDINHTLAVRPYADILMEPRHERVLSPRDGRPLWSSPSLSASVGLAFVVSLQRN